MIPQSRFNELVEEKIIDALVPGASSDLTERDKQLFELEEKNYIKRYKL